MRLGTNPEYSGLFQILISFLLPHHTRLREEIDDRLDLTHLRKQLDNATIDYRSIAGYIVDVMGRLCAPIRDENVARLATLTDLVELFRLVLELISNVQYSCLEEYLKHLI